MIRLRDAADGWAADARLFEKESWLLFFEPACKI
jgi:hypothetical protein